MVGIISIMQTDHEREVRKRERFNGVTRSDRAKCATAAEQRARAQREQRERAQREGPQCDDCEN
jgi:hypothetical protein